MLPPPWGLWPGVGAGMRGEERRERERLEVVVCLMILDWLLPQLEKFQSFLQQLKSILSSLSSRPSQLFRHRPTHSEPQPAQPAPAAQPDKFRSIWLLERKKVPTPRGEEREEIPGPHHQPLLPCDSGSGVANCSPAPARYSAGKLSRIAPSSSAAPAGLADCWLEFTSAAHSHSAQRSGRQQRIFVKLHERTLKSGGD